MSLAVLAHTNKVWTDNVETRLTSRRPMSSFTAWSGDVFLRQTAESNALLSLGQPTMQLVTWRSLTRVVEQTAPSSESRRLTPKRCEAREEFAESASVVVVYGMAR